MIHSDKKNYYEVLEVASNATPTEISKGYHRAKKAYSQDSIALYSLMSPDDCQRILDNIELAFSILNDPSKRKQYDDAHNLNQDLDSAAYSQLLSSQKEIDNEMNSPHSKTKTNTTSSGKMSKLMAKNRYSLEFEANTEFETEIKDATEFPGEFLKRIREYKNVDIPRLADMTKVSKTYLKAIEDENFTALPATVYIRGFVYQYAKCLKLNPDLVANSFLSRTKEARGE